jgi:disulfide bond formation protein DsbB
MTSLLMPLTIICLVGGAFAMMRAKTSPRMRWLSMILMIAGMLLAITSAVLTGMQHGRQDRERSEQRQE